MIEFIFTALYCIIAGMILRFGMLVENKIGTDDMILIAIFWPIVLIGIPFLLLGWLGNWIAAGIIKIACKSNNKSL